MSTPAPTTSPAPLRTPKAFPRKLFYKMAEATDIVGVEAYVLRYWETKFKALKPERLAGDERHYRLRDVELLLRIRHLLYEEKFTIAGAVEQLRRDPTGAREGELREVPTGPGLVPVAVDAAPAVAEPVQLDFLPGAGDERVSFMLARLAVLRRELAALRDELGG